jgi:hypothetical protein
MTTAERNQVDRATARARTEYIRLLAWGLDKLTGTRLGLVTSGTQADVTYAVGIFPSTLTCTCKAGERGAICKHRMLVHHLLVAERRSLP